MVDISYQMVLSTLQTVGLLVGIIYYIMTLRNSQRNQQLQLETRQAQLFMQVYNRWADYDMSKMEHALQEWEWDDYDDWERKYESNIESLSIRATLGKYYEGIGVLIKRGLVDTNLVDDLMSSAIIMYWRKIEPIVDEARRRSGLPQRFEYQEYLYNKIMEIAQKEHPELQA